jgi:3-deoxy-D-manno-octulosonate 8-phosphate phosphatase (KDO 8-P phosphatase)
VKHISLKVQSKARKIKLLLLDVDGVLTDGGIYIDNRGVESKRFDVRDGQGITLLRRAGIEVGFITGRFSNVVRFRARELGVKIVYQRVRKKLEVYQTVKLRSRLADESIAYVGDDIADIPILRQTGLAIVVRDAWAGVKQHADYITKGEGGRGAVREVAELLLTAQDSWKQIKKSQLLP